MPGGFQISDILKGEPSNPSPPQAPDVAPTAFHIPPARLPPSGSLPPTGSFLPSGSFVPSGGLPPSGSFLPPTSFQPESFRPPTSLLPGQALGVDLYTQRGYMGPGSEYSYYSHPTTSSFYANHGNVMDPAESHLLGYSRHPDNQPLQPWGQQIMHVNNGSSIRKSSDSSFHRTDNTNVPSISSQNEQVPDEAIGEVVEEEVDVEEDEDQENETTAMQNSVKKPQKRKRRVLFTKEQVYILQRIFLEHRTKYPTSIERQHIANMTALTTLQVKIWFQNARYKSKKASAAERNFVTGPFAQPAPRRVDVPVLFGNGIPGPSGPIPGAHMMGASLGMPNYTYSYPVQGQQSWWNNQQ